MAVGGRLRPSRWQCMQSSVALQLCSACRAPDACMWREKRRAQPSLSEPPCALCCQVGRAGRFGTKGLAITFVASEQDSAVLNQVQERFDVDIKPLPDQVEASSYMNTS
jgi:hypothetical protein